MTKKILLAVVALLVVIIAVFALLNRSGEELHEGEILIKAGGTTLGVLTVADLQKLPAVQKKMVIQSTGGMTKHDFTALHCWMP